MKLVLYCGELTVADDSGFRSIISDRREYFHQTL